MAGNTFGQIFAVTNFGESHGVAIGCVIDGCPPKLALSEDDIQPDLERRRPGKSRHVTQRAEADSVEILSGVYQGKTTGAPIALLIRNSDARSNDYAALDETFRPGHADYTYWRKYGLRDPRGGGRSSARLTAPMVAAGAVAKKWLRETLGVSIRAALVQLGATAIAVEDWPAREENDFFAATRDAALLQKLAAQMDALREARDSTGGAVLIEAQNMPAGLGEPLHGRLDAEIAAAMMGINAAKGVEIGAGFAAAAQLGSEHGDAILPGGFASNHAGGILGGISSGQDLLVRVAFKPTSSIPQPRPSINTQGVAVQVKTLGRHDPCVALRAPPICEAMLALVLIDQALRHRAQCGDLPRHLTPATPL